MEEKDLKEVEKFEKEQLQEEGKEEVQEQSVEETNEEENISQEELEENRRFDEEEGIEFNQKLDKEDLVKYNYYLMKNGSNYMRMGLMIILGLFIIGYVFYYKSNYWLIAIGALILIYPIFFHFPLQKLIIRRQIKKKTIEEYDIDIKFGSRIRYRLASEKSSPLVDYKNIYKVRKNKEYIYLHMSVYAVIIIKLACCPNPDELVELIKTKYVGTKKYKEIK